MAGYPNDQSNPAGAIPVWLTGGSALTLVDRSNALAAATAETVAAANPARRYLFIQCVTEGKAIWVSFLGTAAPNALGSFQLTAGQTYESGSVVVPNAVSLYCANAADVTVMEG